MATKTVCGPASSSREARPAMSHWAASARIHQLPRADARKPRTPPRCRKSQDLRALGAWGDGSRYSRRVGYRPQTGSGVRTCRRNVARERASRRDTCICDIPSRPAIWVCVMFSKNRSVRTVCSRSGKCSQQRSYRRDVEHLVQVGVEITEGVDDRPSVVFVACPGRRVRRKSGIGAGRDLRLHDLIPVDSQSSRSRWRWAHAPIGGTAPRGPSSAAN